ncbi:hypothetical protein J1N35_009941 [Gossypium stocksii]|uniref:Uncharacterized protein n=1 Tax=Gossypium stocksii TaxID=47602 RepID=A0A9D3W1H0_9ROSI|nr:hypothetical protein J1N35_009941 [Gossypium stocksii]
MSFYMTYLARWPDYFQVAEGPCNRVMGYIMGKVEGQARIRNYRRVLRYYSGEEDGLDMRKALSRDVEKKSMIPLKWPIRPDELEYDSI